MQGVGKQRKFIWVEPTEFAAFLDGFRKAYNEYFAIFIWLQFAKLNGMTVLDLSATMFIKNWQQVLTTISDYL